MDIEPRGNAEGAVNAVQRIVQDGPLRLRRSKEYAALRSRLVAEARLRHEAGPRGAFFWRRAWIWLRIEREVRAELRRLCPPDALYLSKGAR
jgi:hypothetical protein